VFTTDGENFITGIMITFGDRAFRGTVENFIDITIIYYIAQLKHSDCLIFRKSTVTNIRKWHVAIYSKFVRLGSSKYGSFSDNKIQKYKMPSKYVMKI
jgi:hypothetical protein